MRKSFIVSALLIMAVFAGGYVIGQITGVSASSAASSPTLQIHPDAWTHTDNSMQGGPGLGDTPRADGTVTAINGDTITVKADSDVGQSGEYSAVTTINLSNGTQYSTGFHDNAAGASKSSIKVGSYIIGQGKLSPDSKTVAATKVSILPQGAPFGPRGSSPAPGFAPPSGSSAQPSA